MATLLPVNGREAALGAVVPCSVVVGLLPPPPFSGVPWGPPGPPGVLPALGVPETTVGSTPTVGVARTAGPFGVTVVVVVGGCTGGVVGVGVGGVPGWY